VARNALRPRRKDIRWYGIAKSSHRQRNVGTIADFLAGPIRLLNFEADDAREAGEIRAALERLGTPIGGAALRHPHRPAGAPARSDAGDGECARIRARAGIESARLGGLKARRCKQIEPCAISGSLAAGSDYNRANLTHPQGGLDDGRIVAN